MAEQLAGTHARRSDDSVFLLVLPRAPHEGWLWITVGTQMARMGREGPETITRRKVKLINKWVAAVPSIERGGERVPAVF